MVLPFWILSQAMICSPLLPKKNLKKKWLVLKSKSNREVIRCLLYRTLHSYSLARNLFLNCSIGDLFCIVLLQVLLAVLKPIIFFMLTCLKLVRLKQICEDQLLRWFLNQCQATLHDI